MGAQEARAHPDRPLLGDAAGRTQHRELRLEVEAVARLDLDGGDALGNQCVDARQGVREKGVRIRPTRRFDGGEDPAAGPGDVLVARPLEPHLELLRAVAAVHDVGVTVEQGRGDQPSLQVAPRPGREVIGNRVRRTAPGDASRVDRNRPPGNQAIWPLPANERGQRRVGQDFLWHWRGSSSGEFN